MNGPLSSIHTASYDVEGGRAAPAVALRSLVSVGAVVLPREGALVVALALIVIRIPRERAPVSILGIALIANSLTPTLSRYLLNIESASMMERAFAVTDEVLEAQTLRLRQRWASQGQLAPPPVRGKLEPTMTRPRANVRAN